MTKKKDEMEHSLDRTVAWLEENDFQVAHSCIGEEDTHEPQISIMTDPVSMAFDAVRLLAILRAKIKIEPWTDKRPEGAVDIRAFYDPVDDFACLDVHGLTDEKLFGSKTTLKVVDKNLQ